MNSRVSAVVQLILTAKPTVSISPPPVPPNAVYPYITVHEILNRELENMEGISGLQHANIQVNCFHEDMEAADVLREDVKDIILGFSGTSSGRTIQGVNHINDAYLYNADIEAHQCITRFSVWVEV
jgi:hypothetical protein